MVRVLSALMNRKDEYGEARADPLNDPDLLRQKSIVLRFAVVTNGGLAFVKRFLKTEGLENIVIDLDGIEPMSTMTPAGLASLEDDTLYDQDDCIAEHSLRVVRRSFHSLEIWGTVDTANRAMEFCARIGRQLYGLYLNRRGKTVSDKKLNEWSLGVRGLALALAFSHSVPKETLPLFWMAGKIRWNEKELEWIPLFQSGE
jgi:hypothetical protein